MCECLSTDPAWCSSWHFCSCRVDAIGGEVRVPCLHHVLPSRLIPISQCPGSHLDLQFQQFNMTGTRGTRLMVH